MLLQITDVSYISEFKKKKTSFIKKPIDMVYKPIKLATPKKQSKKVDYAKIEVKNNNSVLSPI